MDEVSKDKISNKLNENNTKLLGYEGPQEYSIIDDKHTFEINKNEFESKNISNMKIHEIVEEASIVFSNCQQDYLNQVEKIFLENKTNNIDNKTIVNNVKMYCMALIYYLREKNNLLYIGILFILFSFLLCLFKT
tara:strand:+ start:548 stop:952 length:405 start_codon:yes stop_codon:yes gene_type:complete